MSLVLGLLGIAAGADAASAPKIDPQFDIPKDKMEQVKKAALSGDGPAALRLEMYYGFGLGNSQMEEYWAAVGSEDGSVTCEHNLGQILWQKDTKEDRLRAVYWLKKASDNGDAQSTDMLAKIAKGDEP
jgi:TPR repeat protein